MSLIAQWNEDRLMPNVSRAVERRKPVGDPLGSSAQIEHSQQDQHQPDRQLHGEADARRDHQVKEDDRRPHQDNRDGVAHAPEHSDQPGVPDVPLTAHDRAHRNHVIRIGGVSDSEQKSHTDDSQQVDHVDLTRSEAAARRDTKLYHPSEVGFPLAAQARFGWVSVHRFRKRRLRCEVRKVLFTVLQSCLCVGNIPALCRK